MIPISPRFLSTHLLLRQSGVKTSDLRVTDIPCEHFVEGCSGCKILPLQYNEQVSSSYASVIYAHDDDYDDR